MRQVEMTKKQRTIRQNYDFWIPFTLYIALLAVKLIFIIDNRSMPIISDEFRYVRFARALLEKGSYHSTQYPIGYCVSILPAFLAGEHFYTAIKVLNAVYSSFLPVIIYAIARIYLRKADSAICAFFSAILPFHYVMTMEIMSENLYFPLFFLAIYVLLKDHKHKILSDILLGFLIGAMYLTRHVALVMIPVFALIWFVKQLDEKEKIGVIFLRGFLIVGVIGVTYSPWVLMCRREGFSLKNTLGFSIASKSDPAQLTLPRLGNSFALYVSYVMLAAAPLIGPALKALRGFEWKRLFGPYNRLLLTCYGFSGALLVAVSRHTWRAFYNYPEVTRLKGRYIIYIPVLLLLLAMVSGASGKKITFKRKWTHALIVYGIPAVLFAYALSRNIGQYLTAEVEYYESVDVQRTTLLSPVILVVYTVLMWLVQAAGDFGWKLKKLLKDIPGTLMVLAVLFEGYAAWNYLGYLEERNEYNEAVRCNEVRDVLAALDLAGLPLEDEVVKVYTDPVPEFTFMRRNVEMFVADDVKFYKFEETEEDKRPESYYIITRTPEDFDSFAVNENITSFYWEEKTYYFNFVSETEQAEE